MTFPIKTLGFLMVAGLLTSAPVFSSAHDADHKPDSGYSLGSSFLSDSDDAFYSCDDDASSTFSSSFSSDTDEEAVNKYSEFITTSQTLVKTAIQHFKAKESTKSLRLFKKFIDQKRPEVALDATEEMQSLFSEAGHHLLKMKEYNEALQSFELALEKDKSGVYILKDYALLKALHNNSSTMLRLGKKQESTAYLEEILEMETHTLAELKLQLRISEELQCHDKIIDFTTKILSLVDGTKDEETGPRGSLLKTNTQKHYQMEEEKALKIKYLEKRGRAYIEVNQYILALEDLHKIHLLKMNKIKEGSIRNNAISDTKRSLEAIDKRLRVSLRMHPKTLEWVRKPGLFLNGLDIPPGYIS